MAVDLAHEEPVGAVILESTFTSLRDLARGQVVRVGTLVGTARGVNGHGDLLLQTASGLQVCRSGELSLRLED